MSVTLHLTFVYIHVSVQHSVHCHDHDDRSLVGKPRICKCHDQRSGQSRQCCPYPESVVFSEGIPHTGVGGVEGTYSEIRDHIDMLSQCTEGKKEDTSPVASKHTDNQRTEYHADQRIER